MINEKKELKDVLKPYRLLFRQSNQFYGTVSTAAIDDLYSQLTTWQAREVSLINSNLSNEKLNEILRLNNRIALFFNEEVPLQVFSSVVSFSESELPDISFDQLILDWGSVSTNNQLQLLFVNTETRSLHRSYVTLPNAQQLYTKIVEPGVNYSHYIEVERKQLQSLYVVEDSIEMIQNTYYIDEISPDIFKNVLFADPSIVQRNVESIQSEKYIDDTSFMTVDTQRKVLNYVYPTAESITPIPAAYLLRESFDYINDHGGVTADYRLTSMNISKHVTEYQLYLQGFPVHSSMTSTRISTTWGDNSIFRYRRPYYLLDMDIKSEKTLKELPSGSEIITYIQKDEHISFDKIDEVVVGYYLMQNQNLRLFTLEPSWFIIADNVWTRIMPEHIRGMEDGLE